MANDRKNEVPPTFAVGESSESEVGAFATRLRIALSGRTVQWLAAESGVSHSTIRKYLDGSSPSIERAAALARALGRSLDWLVTGEEPGRGNLPASSNSAEIAGFSETQAPFTGGFDAELLGRIVDRIARVHREEGVRLADVDLGRMAAEKYAEIAEMTGNAPNDPDEWPGFLDVIASRVRKVIRAAAADPINVKREA